MTLTDKSDPDEIAPQHDDPPPVMEGGVMDRLHRQLAAAREIQLSGDQVRAAAVSKVKADARMYRAALLAADAGLTWPEIRQALGPDDDEALPTANQLYYRSRNTTDTAS